MSAFPRFALLSVFHYWELKKIYSIPDDSKKNTCGLNGWLAVGDLLLYWWNRQLLDREWRRQVTSYIVRFHLWLQSEWLRKNISAPLILQCELLFLRQSVVPAGSPEDRRAKRCTWGQECRHPRRVGKLGPLVCLLPELQWWCDGANAALPPRLLPWPGLPEARAAVPGLWESSSELPPPRGLADCLSRPCHFCHPNICAASQEWRAALGWPSGLCFLRRPQQQPYEQRSAEGQQTFSVPEAERQARKEVCVYAHVLFLLWITYVKNDMSD